MEQELKPGDLLFITSHFDKYVREKNPKLTVSLVNRLAKLEEIIDWSSDKGRRIEQARFMSGKWKDLPMEDCKYVISIFYHDIKGRHGEMGVAERGVPMFKNNPKTGDPFFEKVPDWIFKEILKKCETFDVELKNVS